MAAARTAPDVWRVRVAFRSQSSGIGSSKPRPTSGECAHAASRGRVGGGEALEGRSGPGQSLGRVGGWLRIETESGTEEAARTAKHSAAVTALGTKRRRRQR